MALTKCKNCGCDDSFLTTPAPCPTPAGCPDPEPCSEVFDAQCIIYTGTPIVCGETTLINTNTNIAEALQSIVSFFCDNGGQPNFATNGFKITSCLNEDITLPENSTIEYVGPLVMCEGKTLTVPESSTLTII